MDYAKESLRLHGEWKGKIEVISKVPVKTKEDLSLAYTPGVAQPCLEIQKDVEKSYELTRRHNLCAVITDGTAVLGLGDIGPEAGMPVMEGKCALFKAFGDVDAFPLCVKSKAVDGAFAVSYGESENSHCTRIHGLSDAEAKKQESYGALDFENVWTMGPDGYPILKWQTEQ